jgi:biotin carboxyl carrier protein
MRIMADVRAKDPGFAIWRLVVHEGAGGPFTGAGADRTRARSRRTPPVARPRWLPSPPATLPKPASRLAPAPSVPASAAASSSTTAKAAVRNTSSKLPRTNSLLRLKAASGPRSSLTITGANNDQRVISQMPGIISRLAAAVGSAMAAREATATIGTTGAARSRFLSPDYS